MFNIPIDKALHMLVGASFSGTLLIVTNSIPVALVATVTLAISKEIYDSYHRDKHTVDIWDALATAAGGLLPIIGLLL